VLAVVGVEIDHPGDVRTFRVLLPQQFDRAVLRTVVREEDLVTVPERIEHRIKPREQHRQIELLVENGDDDRELDGGVAHR